MTVMFFVLRQSLRPTILIKFMDISSENGYMTPFQTRLYPAPAKSLHILHFIHGDISFANIAYLINVENTAHFNEALHCEQLCFKIYL